MPSLSPCQELRQIQRDINTSHRRIKQLNASMESYRREITTYGMSSPIAEAIESAFPGAITRHSRLNAFTRYPSPVNESIGLEAIFNIRAGGLKKLIYGLIAAAIAGAALLVGYMVKMFRGQEADQRRARANDPRIFQIDPTTVGTSNPAWVDDQEYRGAVANFKSKVTRVLHQLASGHCNAFLGEAYRVKPQGLMVIISGEVTDGIAALNKALSDIKHLSTGTRGDIKSVETERISSDLLDDIDQRRRAIMAVQLPGMESKGDLNVRIEDYLHELTVDVTESGLDKPLYDDEVYELGMQVTKAEKALDTVDQKMLSDIIAKTGNSLKEQQRRMLSDIPEVSEDTIAALGLTLDCLKEYVDMQQNLMSIYVVMSDAVILAEKAFCELISCQLAAMKRAGIDFDANPNDKQFYKIATDYLNK